MFVPVKLFALAITNILTWYENSYITGVKSFITLGPERELSLKVELEEAKAEIAILVPTSKTFATRVSGK